MKINILILLFVFTWNILKAQKKHIDFDLYKVDTLYVFQPIGYIGVPVGNKVVANDSLTKDYLIKFKNILPQVAPFEINYLDNESICNDSIQKYFIDLMYRIHKMDDRIFANNKISETIRSIINEQPGRFFGVVCYSGFEQVNMTKKMIASLAIAAGIAILTHGLFWATVIPESEFLNTYFAIIDKQNDCILFYNFTSMKSLPLLAENIRYHLTRIFKKY